LKEVDETAPTAYADIWHALSRRFGHIDDKRDAMRHFDLRKQGDSESLNKPSVPCIGSHGQTDAKQRDQDLKRRFEDGLIFVKMTQYLRLHTLDDTFEDTVQKARRFAANTEVKPKKGVHIVSSAPEPADPFEQ